MEIIEIKKYLKDNKITYEKLSELSQVPLNTLKNIFSGRTPTPRIDTIQSIEKALGLDNNSSSAANTINTELLNLIPLLTPQQVEQTVDFVKFLLSKNS